MGQRKYATSPKVYFSSVTDTHARAAHVHVYTRELFFSCCAGAVHDGGALVEAAQAKRLVSMVLILRLLVGVAPKAPSLRSARREHATKMGAKEVKF